MPARIGARKRKNQDRPKRVREKDGGRERIIRRSKTLKAIKPGRREVVGIWG